MEINYMLAYGSGEASLRLLWKFGLLDILLPFQVYVNFAFSFLLNHGMNVYLDWTSQAAYFAHHGFRRRDKRTNMLLVSGNLTLFHGVYTGKFSG